MMVRIPELSSDEVFSIGDVAPESIPDVPLWAECHPEQEVDDDSSGGPISYHYITLIITTQPPPADWKGYVEGLRGKERLTIPGAVATYRFSSFNRQYHLLEALVSLTEPKKRCAAELVK
jgi:hypothetical protein